jgi:hypothetical protein
VLYRLWLKCVLGIGAYRALAVGKGVRQTWRAEDPALAELDGAKP